MTTRLAQTRLDDLERVIERGLQTFVNVGNALREIRDNNLHTVEYDTFEAYCSARWGMKHSQAYRLIDAAGVTETIRLSPIGERAVPATESQARPLTKLKPAEQSVAWELAMKNAGNGKVTAAHVEEAVAELIGPPPHVDVHAHVKDPRLALLRDACRNIRKSRKLSQAYEASALRATETTLRKIIKQIDNPPEDS